MDRLGPNGKVSKNRVHLSRWTTFFGWTGPIEIDHSIRPFRQSRYLAVRYFRSVLLVHTCVVTTITKLFYAVYVLAVKNGLFPRQMNKGWKFLKKLWCCVDGGNKVIWLYQLSWKCKLSTVTSYKADVSSVSPSSERNYIFPERLSNILSLFESGVRRSLNLTGKNLQSAQNKTLMIRVKFLRMNQLA